MTGNNFEVIGKFAENYLDTVLVHESVYAKFLPDNRGLNEDFYERGWVKLLSVLVDGFGFYRITNEANVVVTANAELYADYNGNVAENNRAGYPIGGVSAKWTLYRVRFDRAIQFKLDEIDLSLAGLTRMVGPVIDEFYRVKAIPEKDAIITSVLADCTSTSLGNRVLEAPTAANIVDKLFAGEKWLFNHGVSKNNTAIVMRYEEYNLLRSSSQVTRYLNVGEFKRDGLDFRIEYFNGLPIFLLPDDRAFTDVALTNNGYTTSATSRYVNFLFVPIDYIYPIVRLNKMRTYDNSVITSFDGLIVNLHMWHDVIVPQAKRVGIYASIDSTALIGANKIEVAVSSKAGETSGTTVLTAVYTEPFAGLNYAKIYVKTTSMGSVGETEDGGTLVGIDSPFVAADDDLYVALCDANGVILAQSSSTIKFEVAE